MWSLVWFKSSPLSTNKYLALSGKNSAKVYKLWENAVRSLHGREAGGQFRSSCIFRGHPIKGNQFASLRLLFHQRIFAMLSTLDISKYKCQVALKTDLQ